MCDFSIAHVGHNDIERHMKCDKHQRNKVVMGPTTDLKGFLSTPTEVTSQAKKDKFELEVTWAEATMTYLITNLNLPLASANMLTKDVKEMFPDSEIAVISVRLGKTNCLVKDLAIGAQNKLKMKKKTGPFTLSTDGSNDDKSKMFPLVVQTVDHRDGQVVSKLLSVLICQGSATGEAIFSLVTAESEKREVPYANCIAFGSDNANVMVGSKKGVYAFPERRYEQMHLSSCTLHLTHITAEKAVGALGCTTDEILISIFHYLKKSSLQQDNLGSFQGLHDLEQQKMLKDVCTRWLIIDRCIDCLMINWMALKNIFKAEKNGRRHSTPSSNTSSANSTDEKKVDWIIKFLCSPTSQLYCLFLQYTHQVCSGVLVSMQAEEPMIYLLRRSLVTLIHNLLVRFVKPSAMCGKSIDEVQHMELYNQKSDEDLLIGEAVMDFTGKKVVNGLTDTRKKLTLF